jgi:protein-tyrosine phosphatase
MPPPTSEAPTAVLFVCLGNICRSPLAEGVFAHLVRERGLDHRFEIDSAGTGAWHVGERADRRSAEVAARHGVSLEGRARKVEPSDFARFDLVIAMDRDNLRDLQRMAGGTSHRPRVRLLREWDPEGGDEVPDPYYGGADGFERVYAMVRRSCEALLDDLAEPES